MKIILSHEELKRCREFSIISAKNQQPYEFNQPDTTNRSVSEIGRDNLIGKIPEMAFKKMMKERYGIDIEIDFSYYPRGKWDDKDAEINGWRIDVKGTRAGGKWLLVGWDKLVNRQYNNLLPHLFIAASVHWDRKNDIPNGEVNLVGCASIDKMKHGVSKTIILRKGDYIPNTKTTLQEDNFAILFSDLETNWDKVIDYISKNKPPSLMKYLNPYRYGN